MTRNSSRSRSGAVSGACALLLSLTIASCAGGEGGGSGDAEAGAKTLRFTNFEPENIAGNQTLAFGETAEESSGGELTFEYFWAGSLLPGPEVPTGVSSGVADIGLMLAAYNPDVFQIGNWAGALMSLPVAEHPTGVLQSAAAHAQVVLSNEDAQKEFADQGLKVLAPVVPYAHFDLLCLEPVTDLASAEGKRVRVAGEVWAQEAAALGMQPVNLAPGEVYEALQRGVIDCVMHHPPGYIGNGTWEIASHYTPLSFSGAYAYLVMSAATWDSLTPEQQNAIWDGTEAYFEEYEKKALADYATWGTTATEDHGVEFHVPADDIVEALQAHQATVRGNVVDDAPAGVTDPAGYVAEYEGAMDQWLDTSSSVVPGEIDMSEPKTAFVNGGDADLTGWMDEVRTTVFEASRPAS